MALYYLSLLGVSVFAISGSLAAGRKGLDWVGVVVLAVVTSLGGGTIRDILLNRPAIFWIEDPSHLMTSILSSCLTIVFVRFFRPPFNALLIADALGLALFSIAGAQIAEAQTDSWLLITVMGVLTGVAGGIIRDVLTSEIPVLFKPSETLYSVAALAGILFYLLLQANSVDKRTAALGGVFLVAALRFAAIAWKIRLPAFHVSSD